MNTDILSGKKNLQVDVVTEITMTNQTMGRLAVLFFLIIAMYAISKKL